MKNILLFGGSFNPFHRGHGSLIEYINKISATTEVWIFPTHIPPHKSSKSLISGTHRIKIIELSLEHLDNWKINTWEMNQDKPSYTLDTLDHLYQSGEIKDKPGLIIGDDWIEGFHRWKNADELAQKVELTIFHRNFKDKKPFSFPHLYLDNPIVAISSTDIRKKITEKKSLNNLVHPAVEEYINGYGLYEA
ncbi:MAG: nicotinate (nicotinamide) nucleotide adenylyltransferase [Spirochaetaceae bacterium]|jgi:nicotinate-nucleotide adenylyltransferase|nr:nicotinate (nicotinamide) nucleotide adenylyltransferase [Spirochaetaceae bacterium]